MKTIDILVEELPKRGGWPYGAIGAWFLSGEGSIYFWDEKNDCPSKLTIDIDIEVEDSDEEITREQYEAALAAKNEGWIEWGGGECPIEKGVLVDVKLRNGRTEYAQRANYADGYASYSLWRNDNASVDIIAYRLHQPQKAGQAKADEETDLNECARQDSAPVWNGEGLPPAGCMCERSWAGDEWQPCKILFASNQLVVVKMKESGIEDAYSIGCVTFRPLRTEADRKRDAAIKELTSVICGEIPDTGMATAAMYAAMAYYAIAAGKIPGLKLED